MSSSPRSATGLVGHLRETRDIDPQDLAPVAPGPTPRPVREGGQRWTFEELARGLAQAFEGTPYVVRASASEIVVHADLADARWQHLASVLGLTRTFTVRMRANKPGVATQVEESRLVEWRAGVPRLGAQVAVESGKQWRYERRVEYGVGFGGLKKAVDYEFRSSEVTGPTRAVFGVAGWRPRMGAEARGAAVVAALGASSIIIVPIALWLSGRG